MPRTGALLSLSREHHVSLVMARNARRAADNSGSNGGSAAVASAIAAMEAHWHTLMAAHVEQEERLIKIAEDMLEPESVARVLAEHAELKTLADGPGVLEPATRLRRFADLISAHIRYEERTFFPQLQSHPCVADVDTQVKPAPNSDSPKKRFA
jgi:hemerythrin-like domain-containing protein